MSEKGPFSEVDARIGEVCFAPINGLRQSGLSGPKSANSGSGRTNSIKGRMPAPYVATKAVWNRA